MTNLTQAANLKREAAQRRARLAVYLVDRGLAKRSDDGRLWFNRGAALERIGDFEAAAFSYKEARILDADSFPAIYRQAIAQGKAMADEVPTGVQASHPEEAAEKVHALFRESLSVLTKDATVQKADEPLAHAVHYAWRLFILKVNSEPLAADCPEVWGAANILRDDSILKSKNAWLLLYNVAAAVSLFHKGGGGDFTPFAGKLPSAGSEVELLRAARSLSDGGLTVGAAITDPSLTAEAVADAFAEAV